MEKYNLQNLQLIAQGGEADIYSIENDKILRVIRNPNGKTFETEKQLFPILAEHKIKVPTIYEYIEIEGRPAQVMQKVVGSTMLEHIQQHPLETVQKIKMLAAMHAQLLDIHSNCELNSIENVFHYFISQPPGCDKELIDFASKTIKELSIDNSICHGDFHPGNILIQDNTCYIIDWSGAYRSNFVSDIAHTYLLMTHVPEIPGKSHMQYAIISFIGSYIAKIYLKEILKLKKFSLAEFSKWTVIMSLLRIYYGMPSEKSVRINYLNKCYELSEKKIDAAMWYKYL
jgi:tRNA A-37 threonylcarbamoyl transferase component Bud32